MGRIGGYADEGRAGVSEMNKNIEYEIKANAFGRMTGITALGKDAPFSMRSHEERAREWTKWCDTYSDVLDAMLQATDFILDVDGSYVESIEKARRYDMIDDLDPEKFYEATAAGVDRALWRMITNATQMPCTDFYDTIKEAAEKSFSNCVVSVGDDS